MKFRFATDGAGNYGFLKGDDTFVPFKSGGSEIRYVFFTRKQSGTNVGFFMDAADPSACMYIAADTSYNTPLGIINLPGQWGYGLYFSAAINCTAYYTYNGVSVVQDFAPGESTRIYIDLNTNLEIYQAGEISNTVEGIQFLRDASLPGWTLTRISSGNVVKTSYTSKDALLDVMKQTGWIVGGNTDGSVTYINIVLAPGIYWMSGTYTPYIISTNTSYQLGSGGIIFKLAYPVRSSIRDTVLQSVYCDRQLIRGSQVFTISPSTPCKEFHIVSNIDADNVIYIYIDAANRTVEYYRTSAATGNYPYIQCAATDTGLTISDISASGFKMTNTYGGNIIYTLFASIPI